MSRIGGHITGKRTLTIVVQRIVSFDQRVQPEKIRDNDVLGGAGLLGFAHLNP